MTPFRTFEHDMHNEASAMWLRVVAVVVTLACIGALALVLPTWVGLLFAVLGVAACAGWLALIGRARRRARSTVSLQLAPEGLRFVEAARRIEVAWSEVVDVDVDEDRLDVRVHRRGDDPLRIEPMFRGASVYELAEAIAAAWRASTVATDHSGR